MRTVSTNTKRRSKPPAALTGKYNRSSTINFAQGVLARFSISDVNTLLTPAYEEPPPTTITPERRQDDFHEFRSYVDWPLGVVSELDIPRGYVHMTKQEISSSSSLSAHTSRAASPNSSRASAYAAQRQWNHTPSPANSVTSDRPTSPTLGIDLISAAMMGVRPGPPPLQSKRSSRRPQKSNSYKEDKTPLRRRLSGLWSFSRQNSDSR